MRIHHEFWIKTLKQIFVQVWWKETKTQLQQLAELSLQWGYSLLKDGKPLYTHTYTKSTTEADYESHCIKDWESAFQTRTTFISASCCLIKWLHTSEGTSELKTAADKKVYKEGFAFLSSLQFCKDEDKLEVGWLCYFRASSFFYLWLSVLWRPHLCGQVRPGTWGQQNTAEHKHTLISGLNRSSCLFTEETVAPANTKDQGHWQSSLETPLACWCFLS